MTRQLANGSRSHHKSVHSRKQIRTMIGFDDLQFYEVRSLAERNKVSFAEQVRLLIEWGMEGVK